MNKYLVEFLGTLFFLYVILATGNALAIGAALAVAIWVGGNISGGNYWGLPSQSGICSSLKEIFSVNFTGGAVNSIRADLGAELPKLKTDYAYFDL